VAQLSKNINTNTKGIENLQKEVATKQQELTLTVLDNGNIRIGNLQGQTKDFMPATPSGDPMHYAYENAGALYNDTDKPISRLAPWKTNEFWEKNADGTYTYWEEDAYVQHLPGCWYLGGIGDLTNYDMRVIMNEKAGVYSNAYFNTYSRVISFKGTSANNAVEDNMTSLFESAKCKLCVIDSFYFITKKLSGLFMYARNIEYVVSNHFYIEGCTLYNAFKSTDSLKDIQLLRLSTNISMADSPFIYKRAILHMINNSRVKTTAITITLHPDAYVRIANQPDIIEALETKNAEVASTGGSISLVSA
jgi:hypothetical protein